MGVWDEQLEIVDERTVKHLYHGLIQVDQKLPAMPISHKLILEFVIPSEARNLHFPAQGRKADSSLRSE